MKRLMLSIYLLSFLVFVNSCSKPLKKTTEVTDKIKPSALELRFQQNALMREQAVNAREDAEKADCVLLAKQWSQIEQQWCELDRLWREYLPSMSSYTDYSPFPEYIAQSVTSYKSKILLHLPKKDLGMTPTQAIEKFGVPINITQFVSCWISYEKWIYPFIDGSVSYLYFINGQLVAWQN